MSKKLVDIESPKGDVQTVTEKAYVTIFKNRGFQLIGEAYESENEKPELSDRLAESFSGTAGGEEVSAAAVARGLGIGGAGGENDFSKAENLQKEKQAQTVNRSRESIQTAKADADAAKLNAGGKPDGKTPVKPNRPAKRKQPKKTFSKKAAAVSAGTNESDILKTQPDDAGAPNGGR